MKCSIPRCRVKAIITPMKGIDLPLCPTHRRRYQKAHEKHWKKKITFFGEERKLATWIAHWVQMVDLELLNAGNDGTKVKWDGQQWVPEDDDGKPKSSYAQYADADMALPEHATQAGQVTIAKRAKEQAALDRQLSVDVADYQRGRRMELDLELRTKREAEALKAKREKK